MILRPYQKRVVENCTKALKKYKNTLLVSATGTGKTVMLSAIVGQRIKNGRALILAHRDELTNQNSNTFSLINPGIPVSFYNANRKDFSGQTVFSMVQTLAQDHNLDRMPAFDMMVIDEAHHSPSASYKKIIAKAYEKNKKMQLLGVTATPERSDNKGLKGIFSNVADVVTIEEMIRAGHLVEPKAMVVDIGTQSQLRNVRKTANEYSQAEVEAIQNTTFNNEQIVSKWMELASDRSTVVFCSTIQHAKDVAQAFRDAGVKAKSVHGQLSKKEREKRLKDFDSRELQVLCNPAILTEGWDSTICSCVILLRISSHKSTMIQMIGRGLRKLKQNRYPGIKKRDCLILDFGISLLQHGDLTPNVKLTDDRETGTSEAKKKNCPECDSELPIQTKICPLCGYEFKVEFDFGDYDEVKEFQLIELELLKKSPFPWLNIFPSGKVLICSGFDAWSCVCSPDGEDWYAIGGSKIKRSASLIDISRKTTALASADDFMRQEETNRTAKKAAKWMTEPASDSQYQMLSRIGYPSMAMTKGEAAAHLTFKFNQNKIEQLMGFQ